MAGARRTKLDRMAQAKAVRQRVLRGLLDSEGAKLALREIGFDAISAANRVAVWEQERKAKGKNASVAQLCAWWDAGFVTDDEYATALGRIGYGPREIALIIKTCRDKSKDKAARKQKLEEAALAKDEKKKVSDEQKAAGRANAAKAREARQQSVLRAAEERVQRRLAAVTADLAKRLGSTGDVYVDGVRAWFDYLVAERGYSRDGASHMIESVVVDNAAKAGAGWRDAGQEFIELLPKIESGG